MSYATLEQFLAKLGVEDPTVPTQEKAQRCLDAATLEIDGYLGWDDEPPDSPLPTEAEALVVIVNLDRAAEHWRSPPYGALQQGPELAPVLTARDSFERHRRKLSPLKTSWGIA